MIKNEFNLSNFSYELPKELIAQEPLSERDASRLLIIDRKHNGIKEAIFKDVIDLLHKGDLLVLNDTRVIKARIKGTNKNGSKIEVLLLKEKEQGIWEALVNPAKRAKIGEEIIFEEGFYAKILEKTWQGGRTLEFFPKKFASLLERLGQAPLPPYIKKDVDDFEKYQTTYASKEGAVAAPTAGFHFTKKLLEKIEAKEVKIAYLTLHCSLPTFRPVKSDDIREHKMDFEHFEISEDTAKLINDAKENNRRVIAVGTTSVRSLESAAYCIDKGNYRVKSVSLETNAYIFPGYKFKIVDSIITNFHTPCSTNLILISSFAGLELTRKAYEYARQEKFRFYSFGDAMFIL
ncbi:MAG: tRNA preQ1(34) S-adenosylmethionine ribosyltransferase-isomerase QueA [Candidatus Omnitrophota bacterium]|jgi:S-adenosylmethionine:tRNA ribosyltransferase-isomerase